MKNMKERYTLFKIKVVESVIYYNFLNAIFFI